MVAEKQEIATKSFIFVLTMSGIAGFVFADPGADGLEGPENFGPGPWVNDGATTPGEMGGDPAMVAPEMSGPNHEWGGDSEPAFEADGGHQTEEVD